MKLTKQKYYTDLGIPILPKDKYEHAVGEFGFQVTKALKVFDMYGQGEHIPGTVEVIVKLAEDLGLRLRGIDKPISLERVRKKRR